MYTISAPRDVMELTEQVEQLIQKRIESADGVGEVFMWGSRSPQIRVNVNPDRLRAFQYSGDRGYRRDPFAKSGNARRQHRRGPAHARRSHDEQTDRGGAVQRCRHCDTKRLSDKDQRYRHRRKDRRRAEFGCVARRRACRVGRYPKTGRGEHDRRHQQRENEDGDASFRICPRT